MEKATLNRILLTASALLAVAGILLGCFSPPLHDYLFYAQDWQTILSNSKFGNLSITYGPFYYALALLFDIHPKLPHLLSIVCWILSSGYILKLFLKDKNQRLLIVVWLLLFLNPLLWFYIIYYGSIDGVLAFLILFGIVFYDKGSYRISALLLAFGILLKLIPLFIIPFLAFKGKKVNYTFLIPLLVVLLLGFGIAYYCFDINSMSNFLLQADRQSCTLSIFRFLRGSNSPIWLITQKPNVDFLSIYLILSSLLILFLAHIKYNFDYLISCILALILLFTFHLVGNHQYYISLVYLILFVLYKLYQTKLPKKNKLFATSLLFLFTFSLIPLLELILRRFVPSLRAGYDETIGIIVFLISFLMIYTLFKSQFKNKISK